MLTIHKIVQMLIVVNLIEKKKNIQFQQEIILYVVIDHDIVQMYLYLFQDENVYRDVNQLMMIADFDFDDQHVQTIHT